MADKPDEKKAEPPCSEGDTMSLGPEIGGLCSFVRHRDDCRVEFGVARVHDPSGPMPEGTLQLKHRQGTVFDVQKPEATNHKGPAAVSTEAYRSGWDNIFGNKAAVGQA